VQFSPPPFDGDRADVILDARLAPLAPNSLKTAADRVDAPGQLDVETVEVMTQ
jgi:hypothetical protein